MAKNEIEQKWHEPDTHPTAAHVLRRMIRVNGAPWVGVGFYVSGTLVYPNPNGTGAAITPSTPLSLTQHP